MLSFYDFPSWVFLFFLIALAVTIFFYSRKFLRVFTALDMDKSEQQPSKPPKPQKQPNKGQRNEKGKVGKPTSNLEPNSKKTERKMKSSYNSRPPKDEVDRINVPRYRDSIASISSWGSIFRSSDYQEPDLSSIIAPESIKDSETFLTYSNIVDDNRNILSLELNQSAKATGGSDGKIPKSKERLESRSVVAVCPPDQRGHRKIEESIITKSQAKIINHPPKLLQSSSSRTQLDRVPEVIVKTCTTVEEVIKKNELFVERMRFTENVEPKKLRNIP
ncbi:uncharacterized protein LOC141855212 isoform X1 [Brevipalpus obovatus]|uniref:uncharacterized protein LOC141855212 isoform X1 n=1 Tax=Brevipalpus obovatus TaxID=246614 RepID=UPI003D9E384D